MQRCTYCSCLKRMCRCAGWFGLLFYAIASGLPILLQGFLGPFVQRRKPDLLSFTDYVNHVTFSPLPPPHNPPNKSNEMIFVKAHLQEPLSAHYGDEKQPKGSYNVLHVACAHIWLQHNSCPARTGSFCACMHA